MYLIMTKNCQQRCISILDKFEVLKQAWRRWNATYIYFEVQSYSYSVSYLLWWLSCDICLLSIWCITNFANGKWYWKLEDKVELHSCFTEHTGYFNKGKVLISHKIGATKELLNGTSTISNSKCLVNLLYYSWNIKYAHHANT